MGTSSRIALVAFLVTLSETCVMFFLSIMSSKIADRIILPPPLLVVLTVLLLIPAAILNFIQRRYLTSTLNTISQTETSEVKKFVLPRMTMFGVFLFGIWIGYTIGTILPRLFPSGSVLDTHYYEWFGIFVGVAFIFLFAVLKNGFLAGGLMVGYGIGLPTGILMVQPDKNELLFTYFVHLGICSLAGLFFAKIEPALRPSREFRIIPALERFVAIITEER